MDGMKKQLLHQQSDEKNSCISLAVQGVNWGSERVHVFASLQQFGINGLSSLFLIDTVPGSSF